VILYKACGKLGGLPLVRNAINPSLYLQRGAAGGGATGGWQGGWTMLRAAIQAGGRRGGWAYHLGMSKLKYNYSDVEK
jgi:hypothetical protein